MISIIIPTLNEADEIGKVLEVFQLISGNFEIIVVDGGSDDATTAIARESGAVVISAEPCRGGQMQAAAGVAKGDVFWFLHADSIVQETALDDITRALSSTNVVGGNFRLRFSGTSGPARFMSWFYPHIRKIGLFYGDSGIFVRRETYERIGGFRPLPLFEDLDLVYRLKKEGKLVTLNSNITTSSRRFEGRWFPPVFVRWVAYQCLYWIGVSPQFLAKEYYPVRKSDLRR